jgi:hypothetical protein
VSVPSLNSCLIMLSVSYSIIFKSRVKIDIYVLTSCLPFTLRSATVRDSGYISEKVFSVASAVTCVSGELKSAGNVLTGGQRVC